MWIELDKRQCFVDIIDGNIDLWADDVRIVNFEDEGYIESLCDADISTVKYLLETKDVKIFKKLVGRKL